MEGLDLAGIWLAFFCFVFASSSDEAHSFFAPASLSLSRQGTLPPLRPHTLNATSSLATAGALAANGRTAHEELGTPPTRARPDAQPCNAVDGG
jgi:hypothetical protein